MRLATAADESSFRPIHPAGSETLWLSVQVLPLHDQEAGNICAGAAGPVVLGVVLGVSPECVFCRAVL